MSRPRRSTCGRACTSTVAARMPLSGDRVWFSSFEDGRIHVRSDAGAPAPLTPQGPARFADLTVDPVRSRLLAVRETHREGAPPVNDLVAISVDDGSVRVLASGHDFFAAPAPSPDGRRLAWLAWDQPDMPWDAATLWLSELDREGIPQAPVRIAGGSGSAAFQPAWAPDGVLWCVVDPEGWWNLHRWCDGELRCVSSGRMRVREALVAARHDHVRIRREWMRGVHLAPRRRMAAGPARPERRNDRNPDAVDEYRLVRRRRLDRRIHRWSAGPERRGSQPRPRIRRGAGTQDLERALHRRSASCRARKRSPIPPAAATKWRTATTTRLATRRAARRPASCRRCWS